MSDGLPLACFFHFVFFFDRFGRNNSPCGNPSLLAHFFGRLFPNATWDAACPRPQKFCPRHKSLESVFELSSIDGAQFFGIPLFYGLRSLIATLVRAVTTQFPPWQASADSPKVAR